jgi:hypothetical protein
MKTDEHGLEITRHSNQHHQDQTMIVVIIIDVFVGPVSI